MTERPNTVFVALVSAAGAVSALIVAGLAGLGGAGLAALAATITGAFSACVFFLVELHRLPLAAAVLVALIVASGVSLGRACFSYARERRLLARLPLELVDSGPLFEVASAAGLSELFVSPASRPAAFCIGLLRPRVVITRGLLDRLDAAEQAAVVWHEAHHARAREPLKCVVARTAALTFFWMPALRDLLDRYLLAKELAADRLAARRTSSGALAGALAEVLGERLAEFAAARVDRLFDPAAKLPPLFRRSRLAVSILATAGLLFLAASMRSVETSPAPDLDSMLTTMSIHGLPGMAAGLAANLAVLGLAFAVLRRVRS